MAQVQTILVVEDDEDLRELLQIAGEKRSYQMRSAGNGEEALKLFESGYEPNLIILDINMPGMDGLTFCRRLRDSHPKIPVIFLSARTEEYDKILALEIGGDDYLTKPFSVRELFTRVEVALRRIKLFQKKDGQTQESPVIQRDSILLHLEEWICSCHEKEIVLTVSEFRILRKLMENPGIVISRDTLAQAAYPEDCYNTGRSVDMHIHRIRQKIRRVNPDFKSINTVYQVGYKWNL